MKWDVLMTDQRNLITFECPACATTYQREKFSTAVCPSCEETIGERHWLVPAVILKQRLKALKAKKSLTKKD
jgi:ribosomal protein L37AE/L43A